MSAQAPGNNRVLIVDALSGTNDVAVDLCRSLSSRCELSVLTVENTRLDDATFPRLFKVWPYFGGGIDRMTLVKTATAFARLLHELVRHRRGVVHSQFPRFYVLELLVFMLARPFLRRLVFTAHNAVPHERSHWREVLLHIWYRLPHRIVVLSENVRREIVEGFGIRPDRITVIPHGSYVALRESCKGQLPSPLVANILQRMQGQLLVFQFGVIREYKGIDTLIAAARHLPAGEPWQVLVAGGGSHALMDRYDEQIRIAGLKGRVSILREFLSNPDLAALTERADILTFPYHNISQSGALMLGLSFGKPCVCSDIAGFREYLADDEGIFFGLQSAGGLAAVLTQLLREPDRRKRLGEAAWRAANDRYAWENVADRYLDAYGLTEGTPCIAA
jgi:glycosyltransferase involved in cell wall biosynthesis